MNILSNIKYIYGFMTIFISSLKLRYIINVNIYKHIYLLMLINICIIIFSVHRVSFPIDLQMIAPQELRHVDTTVFHRLPLGRAARTAQLRPPKTNSKLGTIYELD